MKGLPIALLCPLYVDVNTSHLVFTHTIGATILFTRHTPCVPPVAAEHGAGAWTTAIASMRTNTSNVIVTDAGFSETGELKTNHITWSNGARWKVPFGHVYLDSGTHNMLRVSELGLGMFDVRDTDTNVSVGILQHECNRVYLNARRGIIVGDAVVWESGNFWSSASDVDDHPSTTVSDMDVTASSDEDTDDVSIDDYPSARAFDTNVNASSDDDTNDYASTDDYAPARAFDMDVKVASYSQE